MAGQDRSSERAPADPVAAPSPQGMQRAFSSRSEDEESVAQMLFILDRQDENPGIERLRRWALEQLATAPGETAVDVGSGSGTMTRRLATLVSPGGRAVGVEPNPALRAVAAGRSTGEESVEILDGLAGHLPFDDSTVDVVWCERVLQHLDDPAGAVREIARVLRPRRSCGADRLRPRDPDRRRNPAGDGGRDTGVLPRSVAESPIGPRDPGASRRRRARHRQRHRFHCTGFPAGRRPGARLRRFDGAARCRGRRGDGRRAGGGVGDSRGDGAAGQAFTSVSVFGFIVRKPAAV